VAGKKSARSSMPGDRRTDQIGTIASDRGHGQTGFSDSREAQELPIDKERRNGADGDSVETESTAIQQANGNGAIPASGGTQGTTELSGSTRSAEATATGPADGNGTPGDPQGLAAWVPKDPARGNPASARVKIADRSSSASSGVLDRAPAALVQPPPLAPPAEPEHDARARSRTPQTWPQRIGVILIAAVCITAAVWYVPGIVSTNRQTFTGSVGSGGIITLNFPNAGEIRRINVLPGQAVHKGQVLASETAPDATAVVKAEAAAIAADRSKIDQLKSVQAQGVLNSGSGASQLSAANSQLAFDQAQLNSNRAKLAASRITAPAAGVVVATNGQPGQVVTPSGIRDYAADAKSSPTSQRPAFSLLPEGPQPLRANSPKQSTLPVLALRTSTTWTVVALIPESAASRVSQGRAVTISVPAAGITNLPGKIDELLPSPVTTSQGTAYQAVIKITRHVKREPLNGMAVDIRLR
jgi:multidrug resistance efflux pump